MKDHPVTRLFQDFADDGLLYGFVILHTSAGERPAGFAPTSAVVPSEEDPLGLVNDQCVSREPRVVLRKVHSAIVLPQIGQSVRRV